MAFNFDVICSKPVSPDEGQFQSERRCCLVQALAALPAATEHTHTHTHTHKGLHPTRNGSERGATIKDEEQNGKMHALMTISMIARGTTCKTNNLYFTV